MIMESMNAYNDGKRDAEQGKPKKNASDFWGPYAGDYQHGYEQQMCCKNTTKKVKILLDKSYSKCYS
jgi:hypothetical protein